MPYMDTSRTRRQLENTPEAIADREQRQREVLASLTNICHMWATPGVGAEVVDQRSATTREEKMAERGTAGQGASSRVSGITSETHEQLANNYRLATGQDLGTRSGD